jgi:membrane associated rhomboid family serine protease
MRPPESWARAKVTLGLTVASVAAWLILGAISPDGSAAVWGAFIPARIDADVPGLAPVWITPLTAAFIHANFVHLAFNMIILMFCGRPTENVLGPIALAILYVVGAYAAAAAHYAMAPGDVVPMIGASGAVSAVIGAYAMMFGRNKVKVANARLALWLNALWLMVAWVGLQLVVGLTFAQYDIRVAVAAHVGGFLAGLLLANPLLLFRYRKA